MSKFKKGDAVRAIKGLQSGEFGIVVEPWYQPSASDWPCVIMERVDGSRFSAHHDEIELLDDPYEYAILRTLVGSPERPRIVGEFWATREETNEGLLNLSTDRVTYKLVKRKKAGPIEDA